MKNNIQEKISSVKNTIKKIQNEINSFQLEKKNNNNNIYNYSNSSVSMMEGSLYEEGEYK